MGLKCESSCRGAGYYKKKSLNVRMCDKQGKVHFLKNIYIILYLIYIYYITILYT